MSSPTARVREVAAECPGGGVKGILLRGGAMFAASTILYDTNIDTAQ